MKVNRLFFSFIPRRITCKLIQTFILLLLVGILAACPAPTPPSSEAPTAEPTATQEVEPAPVVCVKEEIFFISEFPPVSTQPAEPEGNNYIAVYELAPSAAIQTNAKRTVRIRVPGVYKEERNVEPPVDNINAADGVAPVEICPLLDASVCPDQPGLSKEESDQVAALAPYPVEEILRFEMIDFAKMGEENWAQFNEKKLAPELLMTVFTPTIEIWVEFTQEDMADAAALATPIHSLAPDVPGIGYWSCVNGLLAWTDLDQTDVVVEVTGFSPFVLMEQDEISAKDMPTIDLAPEGTLTAQEMAATVMAKLPEAANEILSQGQGNGSPVVVALSPGQMPSLGEFLSALDIPLRTFLSVEIEGWNDPAVGMQP